MHQTTTANSFKEIWKLTCANPLKIIITMRNTSGGHYSLKFVKNKMIKYNFIYRIYFAPIKMYYKGTFFNVVWSSPKISFFVKMSPSPGVRL